MVSNVWLSGRVSRLKESFQSLTVSVIGHKGWIKARMESFKTIVELNHVKVDNIRSEYVKLLNLFFLSFVYQLVGCCFKQRVASNN
jgi:hypothetical protein